jgi:hypothetical protein
LSAGCWRPCCCQVFRVHALHVRKEPAALLPLLQTPEAALTPLLPSLRGQALQLLTTALGGDALAAEYLLLCCCGGVFSRSEMGAHGLLPLNLTGCPPPPAAVGGASTSSNSSSGNAGGELCWLLQPAARGAVVGRMPHAHVESCSTPSYGPCVAVFPSCIAPLALQSTPPCCRAPLCHPQGLWRA